MALHISVLKLLRALHMLLAVQTLCSTSKFQVLRDLGNLGKGTKLITTSHMHLVDVV